MAGINLIKNLKALIYVRVPLETIPTNQKLKFDNKNKDLKSNYSNSSDSRNDNNNEWKYNCNNDNNIVDDKNNSSNINKKFFDNNNNDQKL